MSNDQQPSDTSSDLPVADYNAGAVGALYRSISMMGIVMAVGGVFAELYFEDDLRSGLWPVTEVIPALMAGEISVWTTFGIWIFLAGPVLALMSMFITGIRRRSWPAVILSGLVLTVIILAIPTMSWLGIGEGVG